MKTVVKVFVPFPTVSIHFWLLCFHLCVCGVCVYLFFFSLLMCFYCVASGVPTSSKTLFNLQVLKSVGWENISKLILILSKINRQ